MLPRGRGRSPISWSILQNRKRIVWNLFRIVPGVDDGPILESETFDINEWDDIETLGFKCSIVT